MVRGVGGMDIFRDDADKQFVVLKLRRLLDETDCRCCAWALLTNHAHLMLLRGVTPIGTFMARLNTSYAMRFSRRYGWRGHVFENRFKSLLVNDARYFNRLIRYIHLNPVAAGLVELEALVAHLLARCADGQLRIETTAAAMGRIPGASLGLTARSDGPDRVIRTDLHGADLTRFPPGMQSALRALAELGATVDVPSSTARLWLLQPDGRTDVQTSIHPTVDLRVAALEEC